MSSPPPETGYVRGPGSGRLFYRWHPAPEPRAAILLIHGLAEHSGRYLHVFDAFNARGYDCFAVDYRGHGRADGRRAYIDAFSDYLDDVSAAFDLLRERRPEGPRFLLGHSQGGLICAAHALERRPTIDGLVLSGPFMGLALAVPAWKDILARVMSRLWPTLAVPTGIDPGLVSRDTEVVAAYTGDPLVFTSATARWYCEVLEGQAQTNAGASRIDVPTLVVQGMADALVDPAAAERFVGALGSADKTFKPYEGLYHEVLNEPEREQVMADIAAWLDARVPAAAATDAAGGS